MAFLKLIKTLLDQWGTSRHKKFYTIFEFDNIFKNHFHHEISARDLYLITKDNYSF